MKKVNIVGVSNIDNVIKMLDEEGLYLNNGYDFDFIKEEMLKGGSGVYEFCFGSRGGLENFEKCDEYMSKEEMVEKFRKELIECNSNNIEEELEFYEGELDEFYNDEDNLELCGDYDFVKVVGYFEESWSLFVKVEV